MIYLLESNTCIVHLKGKNLHLKQKLDNISLSEIAVCSVVKSELILVIELFTNSLYYLSFF